MSDGAASAIEAWRRQPRSAEAGARLTPLDLSVATIMGHARAALAVRRGRWMMTQAQAIEALETETRRLSDAELRQEISRLRPALRERQVSAAARNRALALLREASGRSLGLRHHANQLAAALAVLRGMLAELEGGEGKTLATALAAAGGALGGRSVHVVTANDYLAARDAKTVQPFFSFVGLKVDVAAGDQDAERRRRAYGAAVTYVTNKELAFDYLRDRLEFGPDDQGLRHYLQRLCEDHPFGKLRIPSLDMAIVDEADSVLIDEARTPLVISAQAPAPIAEDDLRTALDDARRLALNQHFVLRPAERATVLLDAGCRALAAAAAGRAGPWRIARWREQLVELALTAEHLFAQGIEYRLRDGRVEVVDEFTGRAMPDRSFGAGLHELLAVKEGLAPQGQRSELARLTYQRLFRRYAHLGGMTATAREVGAELWAVYRLQVARLPTHRPLARRYLGAQLADTGAERWARIADRARQLSAEGRPVLVGTRTLAASRAASAALAHVGIDHVVLNADQGQREAAIIAGAGRRRQVTVATNMAGRGTDILLDNGVAGLGGLHVIISELHESARIDRQLAARCARQGDPGSWEQILAWDDPLLSVWLGHPAQWLGRPLPPVWRSRLGYALMKLAQARAERRHARTRRELLLADEKLNDLLAFAGPQK